MFDTFLSLIHRYGTLDAAEVNYLKEHLEAKTYKKNDIFFSEGEVSRTIYFVLKGCVRLFYNVDGQHKTAFFYPEGKFICVGESYTFQTPAKENYQAIEESQLILFDRNFNEALMAKFPKFEMIARIAAEDELITCQKMIASFVTKSPEERYQELLEANGDLFLRVPQQYIASYLGVSPETLSRIKKRLATKKCK